MAENNEVASAPAASVSDSLSRSEHLEARKTRMTRRAQADRDAKRRARSRSNDDSSEVTPGAHSSKSDKASRQYKEDRDAKRRARSRSNDDSSEVTPGAHSSKSDKASRQYKEDRDAKRRARSRSSDDSSVVTPGAHSSKSDKASRQYKEDRDAKRRARSRSNDDSSEVTPGAHSSKSDKASLQYKEDRDAKRRARSRSSDDSSVVTPGAHVSNGRTRQGKEARNADRQTAEEIHGQPAKLGDVSLPSAASAQSVNESGPLHLEAEVVDDKADEARARQHIEKERERLKQEMEAENERSLNAQMNGIIQGEMLQTDTPDKFTSSKTFKILLVVLFIAIVAGVGAYFGTRDTSADPAVVPIEPKATSSPTGGAGGGPTVVPVTAQPTGSPTQEPLYDPPTPEDCVAIVNGESVEGQEEMIVRNFDVVLDVSLESEAELDVPLDEQVQAKTKQILIPKLVGCSEERRALTDFYTTTAKSIRSDGRKLTISNPRRYAVANADVTVTVLESGSCQASASETCYSVVITLDLSLKSEDEKLFTVVSLIIEAFGGDLVAVWNLGPPYGSIVVQAVNSNTPTLPPSAVPTDTPSSSPTGKPTSTLSNAPTASPSKAPTFMPVSGVPTKAPTRPPTFMPVSGVPTKAPTSAPTPQPTRNPTSQPTRSPTRDPTPLPTPTPTRDPTPPPTTTPTRDPTPPPTTTPTRESTPPPTTTPTRDPTSFPTTSEPTECTNKCVGDNPCVWLDVSDVGCNSCIGDNVCSYRSGSVGEGSCIGVSACEYNQNVDIGDNSCLDPYACACLGFESIGDNQCQNTGDCCTSDGAPLSAPASSCQGEQACSFASADIGTNSCNNAFRGCYRAAATIGDNSCNDGGCQGVYGFVDDDSCNGSGACPWSQVNMEIGSNSCNCEECCNCLIDQYFPLVIPAGSCNQKVIGNHTVDFVNGGSGPYQHCCD
jgi:hypothetical protein